MSWLNGEIEIIEIKREQDLPSNPPGYTPALTISLPVIS